MSMLSKQEVDVAVKVLQDKVEFIMKSFNVGQPNLLDPFGAPLMKSLLQVYYEVKAGVPLGQSVGSADESDDATELDVITAEATDASA